MRRKVLTAIERRTRSAQWRKVFVILPVKVAEDDARFLEYVERREILVGQWPHNYTETQYRAVGATDFYPPYPFMAGEAPTTKEGWAEHDRMRKAGKPVVTTTTGERRANRATKYPNIEVVPPTEHG